MTRMDPRLYCVFDGSSWQEGRDIVLSAGQAHYLGKVMRLQSGDSVRVFNGHDGEWCALISDLKRQKRKYSPYFSKNVYKKKQKV